MYVVPTGFADASEIPAEVMIVFGRPASFSVEPLQTKFDLVMSTLPRKDVAKEEKNRNL